jgi:transketolase
VATRKAGGAALKAFSEALPGLVGGSADLAPSNNSNLAYGSFTSQTPEGRTIHFGVREHAMGAMVNGMTLHSGLKVFGATFLVFSDYMRPPIRLASLMKIPSIFPLHP